MSYSYKYSFRKLIAFLGLFLIYSNIFNAFAQTKRGNQTASSNQTKAVTKCSGAWTGRISYNRTQSMSDNKTVERVSGRGQDTTSFEMNYNYSAQIAVVESPENNGSSIGKASINSTMTSNETVSAKERNSCDQGKTWRVMTGDSVSKSATSGMGKDEANVSIGVNDDGTYTVSVGLPQIKGKTSGSQSSKFSGQCQPKEGKTFNIPATETTIDGNSLTSDGTNRVNPSDPNRLSGSYSKTWQNVTETITWSLQKCGAPLRITDLKFADMKFPNWNEWKDITEQTGTIDGNLVKIKATILNTSGETKYADLKLKETYKGDKWDGAKPDGTLEGGELSVRVDAGEETEVEMVWNSSGYAWYDDGRPRLVQRIKAELEENGKKTDELTKNLKVAPKPVVLVHGLWSNWQAWESWQNILTTSHSYDWKAFPVGEKPEKGLMNTGGGFLSTDQTNGIFENSQQLGKYIRYAQEDRNAWHVDIVAHSMGGLISRHYIHQFMPPAYQDGKPQISHLVMLGTPNMGSPCADVMNIAFELTGKNVEAVRQLRQDVVADFNKVNTNRKGVKFSVLAGNPLPSMCKQLVWNDGVVPVPSAKWQIKDNAESKNVHTELTGTSDFSAFVKPRLAVGPKGNHTPETPILPGQMGRNQQNDFNRILVNSIYESDKSLREELREFYTPDFAKSVKIPAKSSIEIEIPVEQAQNFGLTFMASNEVSATLLDDKGAIAGKNLTKTPEASAWFRSIYVDKNVSGGVWKLKLENTSDRELETVLATWKNAVK